MEERRRERRWGAGSDAETSALPRQATRVGISDTIQVLIVYRGVRSLPGEEGGEEPGGGVGCCSQRPVCKQSTPVQI
jgi:hypothetical protein